jgi:hypothetical protein
VKVIESQIKIQIKRSGPQTAFYNIKKILKIKRRKNSNKSGASILLNQKVVISSELET